MTGQLTTLIAHPRRPEQAPYQGNVSADIIEYLEELQALRALEERVSVAVAKLTDLESVYWEETVTEVVELLSDAP